MSGGWLVIWSARGEEPLRVFVSANICQKAEEAPAAARFDVVIPDHLRDITVLRVHESVIT
ncbi:MAG: hypothetical protein K0S82_1785 [Gaiellaceae bacterium]|jgi:hypothetical protein|nr:hypothetical protein [Gaiellaceae bacterium]